MFKHFSVFLLTILLMKSFSAYGGAPVTAIDFSSGYDFSELEDRNLNQLISDLTLGRSPVGRKLAIVHWYPYTKNLISRLQKNLETMDDSYTKSDTLLLLAYAKMRNYPSDMAVPKRLLSLVYPTKYHSESYMMVETLLWAQELYNSDNSSNFYAIAKQIDTETRKMENDLSDLVTKSFIDYLSQYESDCKNCSDFPSPSFSCSSLADLTSTERAICKSPSLSRADRMLSSIFFFSYQIPNRESIWDNQRTWLEERDACDSDRCIEDKYAERITVLNNAFSDWDYGMYVRGDFPGNMADINHRSSIQSEKSHDKMMKYLAAALRKEKQLTEYIQEGQKSWEKYAEAHCDSVYKRWEKTSQRIYQSYKCHQNMEGARTHAIWRDYLTYGDRTPPVLPEPFYK